jgi:ATP-dependent exoDNAse (exonuclease V) beta subunit
VERYIALVSEGVSPQHILAITFTNKAASEMRERILAEIQSKLPLVWLAYQRGEFSFRISTIHSFLAEILFRFSLESGIDPDFEITGEVQSRELFEQCVNEALGEIGARNSSLLFHLFEKLDYRSLKRILRSLFEKRPLTDFWARVKSREGSLEGSLASVYLASLSLYEKRKAEEGRLDFADLEIKSYQILEEEDASDLLLFFNEHVQHLLMDEFQDTNGIQWQIVRKLTEDWLSGQGLREVTGASLYLVGDPKQSIYRFRGADVTVFQKVREMFEQKASEEEGRRHFSPCVVKRENYRSLSQIVDFVNSFFKEVMKGGDYLWEVSFEPFEAVREGEGDVALIPVLKDKSKKIKEHKVEEATLVARKIAQLVNEGGYSFKDIALLFPIRTHFKVFEEALRERGIPFQTEKGRGFFSSPEVSTFISILKFLVRKDEVSLFSFLQSAVSPFDLSAVFKLSAQRKGLLWDYLKSSSNKEGFVKKIEKWLKLKDELRPSFLLELIYEETFAYLIFSSPGAQANLDKLLQMITQLEKEGGGSLSEVVRALSLLEMGEEGGAQVEEELDAVKIMTIHSAKGLQFPVVFVVDVDGLARTRPPTLIYDEEEDGGKIVLGFEREESKGIWERSYQKDFEEKKRLFYVACTRAQDALYISGVFDLESKNKNYFWNKLLKKEGEEVYSPYGIRVEEELLESEVQVREEKEEDFSFSFTPRSLPLQKPQKSLQAKLGEIIHTVLDEASQGLLASQEDVEKRVHHLSLLSGLGEKEIERVNHDIEILKRAGWWSKIVLRPGFSELSYFSLEGKNVVQGRFDKVILSSDEVWVIDYKTDEVDKEEVEKRISLYLEQAKRYREAARNLWKGKKIRFFLLFTYCGLLKEVLAEET